MARGSVRRGAALVVVALVGSLVPLVAGTVCYAPGVASASGSPVTPSGKRQLVAGGSTGDTDASGSSAQFSADVPAMVVDGNGTVFIADRGNGPAIAQGERPAGRRSSGHHRGRAQRHVRVSCSGLSANYGPNTIQFGPDGYLYAATGNDNNSTGSWAAYSGPGKILKINPNTGATTTAPWVSTRRWGWRPRAVRSSCPTTPPTVGVR